MEAGLQDDAQVPPVCAGMRRRLPPACVNHGRRLGQGLKRVAITATKAYLSFVGVGAAIKLAKHHGDLRPDPLQFVRAAFTGTERADSLEVQKAREIVLQAYGDFIDTKTQCVDPVVTFVPALRNSDQRQTSGQFIDGARQSTGIAFNGTVAAFNSTHGGNSTAALPETAGPQARSGELRFTAYNLYLPQIAVHEYLHCFTHPNFRNATADNSRDPLIRHVLVEGSTQYLTLQTPFDRRGDYSGRYSAIYVDEVKFIGKVVDDIGIDTLKKAYLCGDPPAIEKMLAATADHADVLFRG